MNISFNRRWTLFFVVVAVLCGRFKLAMFELTAMDKSEMSLMKFTLLSYFDLFRRFLRFTGDSF